MNRCISIIMGVFALAALVGPDAPAGGLGVGVARAQQGVSGEPGGSGLEGLSGFEVIFKRHYPDLDCRDAPTVLNGSGITCMYTVTELPYGDDRTWEVRNNSRMNRPRGEMNRTFPTMGDVRFLFSLSGLDMSDILRHDELLAAGERSTLLGILTRLIDPKMDKHNKKSLEGFDPTLCLNDAGDHVFDLRIDESVLADILGKEHLFHKGRYEKYRSELMQYLADHPRLSDLHVGIGNSFFAEGDLAQAMRWYASGLAANPLNPMLEYSMSFCHPMNGETDRAIESLIASIFACRNNMFSWMALEELLSEQGKRIMDRRFKNMVIVDVERTTISISKSVSPGVMLPWLYYGAAEIASEHDRGRRWGSFGNWKREAVELYRVAHLLGKYVILKGEGTDTYDPFLESLESIYRNGYLQEYVLFDKITPYDQYYLISVLPEDGKLKMRAYFDRFIISG